MSEFAASRAPQDIRQVLLDAIVDDSDEEFINRVSDILAKGTMPSQDLFLPFVENEEEIVRRRAVFLLSQTGGSAVAIAAICSRLKDDSFLVRSSAVSSLGRLQAKSAVPALLELFAEDGEHPLCKAAAEALGKIGDPAAIPVLQEAAKRFPIVIKTSCNMAVSKIQSAQRAAAL